MAFRGRKAASAAQMWTKHLCSMLDLWTLSRLLCVPILRRRSWSPQDRSLSNSGRYIIWIFFDLFCKLSFDTASNTAIDSCFCPSHGKVTQPGLPRHAECLSQRAKPNSSRIIQTVSRSLQILNGIGFLDIAVPGECMTLANRRLVMRKMGLSEPICFFWLRMHMTFTYSHNLFCRCEMQVTQSELSEMLCDSSLLSENSDWIWALTAFELWPLLLWCL